MADLGEAHAGIREEVAACFEAYDAALLANDVTALDGWFWESDDAVRYGVAEELYGHKAIAAHRRSSAGVVARGLFTRRSISTFGSDAATVCAEFDAGGGGTGRQTQTWIRMPDGWRIVCAHVSVRGAGNDSEKE
jgi:Protein of unknown function (DUF3225)